MKRSLSHRSFFQTLKDSVSTSSAAAYFFIPLLVALVMIAKVFVIPGCFAFDAIDDANLTFPNLSVARDSLRQGKLPLMNLYHGFGTPLLGDTLTYPFAVHSLTYWFFQNHVAMTINRAVIAFFTVLVLTAYFKHYMSKAAASVCAILAFGTPGFLWHYAHHHYQSALLFFAVLLILQRRFRQRRTFASAVLLYAGMTLLMVNTSINLVAIMLPFFVLSFLVDNRLRVDRVFGMFCAIAVSSVLFIYPEVSYFVTSVALSARFMTFYGGAFPYTPTSLALLVAGISRQWRGHVDAAVFLSLPVIVLAILGLIRLFRKHPSRFLAWQTTLLGLAPIAVVLFLLLMGNLWKSIPFVRSMDITRVFWVSNIFLLVAAGVALDSLAGRRRLWFCRRDRDRFAHRVFEVRKPVSARASYRVPSLSFVLMCSAVLVAQVPSFVRILGYDDWKNCRTEFRNHHFSPASASSFWPREFLQHMAPYTRLAADVPSYYGHDFRAAEKRVFGSASRSTLFNRAFCEFLIGENMIVLEDVPITYHFTEPEDINKLNLLGIRYVIHLGPSEKLAAAGWRLVSRENILHLHLYENPVPATPVYLVDGKRMHFLGTDQVDYRENTVSVRFPELSEAAELVVTLIALPGWKVFVNHEERAAVPAADRLIHIPLAPGDADVLVTFSPVSAAALGVAMVTSPALFVLAWMGVARRKNASA